MKKEKKEEVKEEPKEEPKEEVKEEPKPKKPEPKKKEKEEVKESAPIIPRRSNLTAAIDDFKKKTELTEQDKKVLDILSEFKH